MSWSVAEPSFSSGSPESCEDGLEEVGEESRGTIGDLAKIPTSDTLVITPEELRDKSKTDGKGPVMHKVVIPPQRRAKDHNRSPSREMSPILRTRRSQIPSRLLSPIALSMPSRASLGAQNRAAPLAARTISPPRESPQKIPSRFEAKDSRARTPPVPDVRDVRDARSPTRMVMRMWSRPSRHSIGSCTTPYATPPVPSRSASQGRLERPEKRERTVKVAVTGRSSQTGPMTQSHPGTDKDDAGRTQLMHAVRAGDLQRVTSLLRAGCWVDDTDSCKCTALMYAATSGHVAIAHCLVEHAANVNAQSHDKWTPLIAAAYNGHVSMADFLVSRGADVEYADERGWTALMHVAFNGRQDIVRCLLQYGARVEREDKEGRTALVYAAFGGHLEIVKCFLAYGRLQSGKWHLGGDGAAQLAMMFAADKGHAHVVQAFLDASLASAPTKRSALELANANGHHQVVQLLQSDQVQEGVAK
ncbi:unnamed protein product [Durusdinium trenchii]|uniref:Uncharacterized protein n=2 Tax=Durusdinium trenchii TaxID=1381693 RepID=A0ABP0NQK4_9DINO